MVLKSLEFDLFKPAERERVTVEGEGPTALLESLSRMDQRLITHFIFSQSRRRAEERRGTGEKEQRRERAREKERSGRGGPILDYFILGPGMTVSAGLVGGGFYKFYRF